MRLKKGAKLQVLIHLGDLAAMPVLVNNVDTVALIAFPTAECLPAQLTPQ